jgi:SAM-dependent methyltransferase
MVKTKSMNKTNKTSYDIECEVEGSHWWFSGRRKLIKSILSSVPLPPGYITLDIGCGVGSNLEILRAMGLHAIGLDQSRYALSLARKKLEFPLINGDLNALPVRPNSIGLIIAMDILEHLEDDANGIRQLYHALKEGGILIVTAPVFQFLWGIQDFVTGHKRRYSRKEILNKLACEKFEVFRSFYFNFFLFFPIFFGRRMAHLLGLKIRSENEINFPFMNFLLKAIFSLEPFILKFISFPFGVSIFCIAKK